VFPGQFLFRTNELKAWGILNNHFHPDSLRHRISPLVNNRQQIMTLPGLSSAVTFTTVSTALVGVSS
jgi:hypothetical protein